MQELSNRYILTIATGKRVFLDMAANLARSFFWWHPGTDIKFQLVTDQHDIPADIASRVQIITVAPGELAEGFSSKLFLDRLASDGKTLFIDSDCLIFGPLDSVFDKFNGHAVSVVGSYISEGEWFGDIGKIRRAFDLPHIPKFNGGIYYVEKGEKADSVYKTARDLEKRYDEIGFVRLRNRPNDEVIMALAMQLHGHSPIEDDGSILSDPQACSGGYQIDVLNGKRWLLNPPAPHKLHRSWYPFTKVSPVVVHFLGSYTNEYPYRRETLKLKKYAGKYPDAIIDLIAFSIIEAPARINQFIKNMLRPAYRVLFGIRKTKTSERI